MSDLERDEKAVQNWANEQARKEGGQARQEEATAEVTTEHAKETTQSPD